MATYPTAAPGNNLSAIQIKVRRLTRSPSEAQLTTDDLNNYINTFVMYDFPEQLRTFNLYQSFDFWCNPYQDTYYTDVINYGGATQAALNPLYDFENKYLTVHPPIYIAGFESSYFQSRQEFFRVYPNINSRVQLAGIGDNVTTTFSGVIPLIQGAIVPNTFNQQICLVKGQVLFESIDLNNNGLAIIDVPVLDATTGNPTIYGNLYVAGTEPKAPNLPKVSPPYSPLGPCNINATDCINPFNFINYITGAYTVTFPFAPLANQQIFSQTITKQVSRPISVLYFDNKFILRPVPDQPYQINMEVFVRPTQLMETSSIPELQEWWQYIAYGASLKIFQDRMDLESVQMIMPEFKTQENLCNRRTVVQLTNQRTATIYSGSTGNGNNNMFGNNGWGYW